MEQWLQNEEIVGHIAALVGTVVTVLGIILTALAYRVARAIQESGAENVALTREERVRRMAREAVAAVEQLYPEVGSTQKLAKARAYGRDNGIELPREAIEAALKEAEGAWRLPAYVLSGDGDAGLQLVGPEGSD